MRLIDADELSTKVIFVCEDGYDGADMVLKKDIDSTPTIEAEPVKHGQWRKIEGSSGWEQHRCSCCKKEALFDYTYIDDYDEGVDGEWEYIGQRENGVQEHLTDYCPNCGAKMRGNTDE